jgi:hypothetical protein
VAYGAALERRFGATHRGFESLSLRQEKGARIFRYGHFSSLEEKDSKHRFDLRGRAQELALSTPQEVNIPLSPPNKKTLQ